MAAYDNVSLGNAPSGASYAAPLLNFAPLAQLPEQYYKGQQNAHQLEIQNAFKQGLPIDKQSGQPDYNAMAAKLFQLGDTGAASNVAMTGYKLKQLQQDDAQPAFGLGGAAPAVSPGAGAPNAPPAMQPAPGGPAAAPQPQQPALSSAGTDNVGADTARSVATESFGGRDVSALIPRFAKAIGVNPDQPLNPQQVAQLRTMMTRTAQSMGPQTPQPAEAPQAQPQGPATVAQPAGPQSAAAALVPQQYVGRERDFAEGLRAYADRARQQARREGVAGIPSKAMEDRAASFDARAAKIEEALAKDAETTPGQKEARDPAVIAAKTEGEQQKLSAERGNSLYKGLQGASRAADEMRPHLQAMTAIFNDPNFTSGTGEGIALALKRVQAAIPAWMGGNPNAALPNEALRKVLAQNILNQTDQLKAEATEMGGTSGRIFQQQIKLMEDSAQKPENTVAALRYLTELGTRAANHANEVARLASQYKGGRLDPEFDLKLQDYNRQHPMFTPAEMSDIRLVAPPVAPKLDTPEAAAAWARKAGIKAGEPIKLPSGRVVPAP